MRRAILVCVLLATSAALPLASAGEARHACPPGVGSIPAGTLVEDTLDCIPQARASACPPPISGRIGDLVEDLKDCLP